MTRMLSSRRYYGLNAKNLGHGLLVHPTYLRFGLFCKSFGDLWVHLVINNFSPRISNINGIGNLKI